MLAEVSLIVALPASIFGIISLTVTVFICLCGCRGKQHKDDLGGIEGHVKITNPEDFLQEVNANNIHNEITVAEKPQNTAKRSLPDLPVDQNTNHIGDGTWEPNGDATSDLYATVVLKDEKNKKHERQRSETDSVGASYTHLKKEHPYDKLKKVEHPYAQVKDHGSNQPSAALFTENKSNENETDDQGDESEPITPERPHRESTGNIPAATAIAGHVTASDDLPYMTPPAHFSGDSQDSGKGYTSISVREPLSAIRAETKQDSTRRADPHYATVSDDSDDMYAAIDDPSQVYTSESETYAQIQQSSTNKSNPAPQPPSVNSLKQMTVTSQSHSRQASSSSAASSTAVSSPKPEKRPANSPLPPPPAATTPDSIEDLYAFVDKKSDGSPRNLEDMYAKVNKKGRRDADVAFERGASTESGASESSDSMSYKMQTNSTMTCTTTPSTDASRSCHSYKSTTETSSPSTSNRQDKTGSSFSLEADPQQGYEKLDFDGNRSDPGYETVNKGPPSDSDPNYEQLKPQEHDYASIARTKNARIDRHESDISDGYARVQSNPRSEIYSEMSRSEVDGYARVERKEEDTDDGYAKVLKCNNNRLESNYERVQSKHSDPVGEPTYESLGNEFETDDPNYESVHYLISSAHIEPPYQLLRDCESGASAKK